MANFLLNNAFRIAVSTLNFVSPSLVADILLHPFDFATVLLQIGYDPEGIKYETASLVSVLVQYALFTFYIPYLLTSMQGLQFMGMPHPGIFYYVNYIYSKEGFGGCYRGLMPKICERLIMVSVNEQIRRSIYKDLERNSIDVPNAFDQDNLVQTLINSVCSQFFAVLASHPFHVLMVSSFAEFTYNKKSSILELSYSIYTDDGYFGFFTGLTARLLGELLSLIFSVTYTTMINKQVRRRPTVAENLESPSSQKTVNPLVNYVTDMSRFTALKPNSVRTDVPEETVQEDPEPNPLAARRGFSQIFAVVLNFLRNITQNSPPERTRLGGTYPQERHFPFLAYIPWTSKIFYYIVLRDFLSKKISNPFFLVSHCAIVLNTGWDKFPLSHYLEPMVNLLKEHLIPSGKKHKKRAFNSLL